MAGKDQKQKVTPIVIDGFEINAQNVNFYKLQEFSLTLYEKLQHARKERSYLMLDRDKLRTILHNLRHDMKLADDTTRIKEDEMERTEEKHRQDLKEVDEEVKFILYDHKLRLEELASWEKGVLTKAEDANVEEELELLQQKRRLKEEHDEVENKIGEDLKQLKESQAHELKDLKEKLGKVQLDTELEHKRNLNYTVEQMSLTHEMEMSEAEERKNTHIAELKSIHKARIDEMKNYFNSMTSENLTVMSHLKQSLDAMKKNKITLSVDVKLLKQENARLREPLSKSKAEVKNLTRQLVNYEKDLLSLKNNKRLLQEALDETESIKKASSVALRKLRSTKDSVVTVADLECLSSIMDFKCNAVWKRRRLEESVEKMMADLKKKHSLIRSLSSDTDVQNSQRYLEPWEPRRLAYELALVCKAHDELVDTLQERLDELCVPEFAVGSWRADLPTLGQGPAALVSKQ